MRTSFVKLIVVLAAVVISGAARAEWPEKPVRVVVPFSVGSGGDVLIRLISDDLGKRLGQPVLVDNREGAGGNIGSQAAAGAAPDGYTLLLAATGNFVINQHLFSSYTIDPLKAFAPIMHIADIPGLLFSTGAIPPRDFGAFVAYAKANKGKVNFGSPGVGTTPHLGLASFDRAAGLDMTHVAYRGSPQVLAGLLAGDLQLGFGVPGTALPYVATGKLHAIAVTGDKRMAIAPNTPTFKELGFPSVGGETWWALVAPAGTPEVILDRMNNAMRQALASTDIRKRLEEMGFGVVASTRKEMNEKMASEATRWTNAIKDLRIERIN